jgi:predicted phosphate transport protein (TIGR00153 family)
MNWIKGFFKPRQNNFVRLLIEQAEWTAQGIDALEKYMKKRSDKYAEQVQTAELEADEVRRILIDELNRTFITPIDREDIHALSRSIDDVLDYAYTTIDEMEILDVEPNDYLRRITSLVGEAAHEILLAMQRLSEHPNVANDHAVRAKALENRVEQVYREAVADLFHQPQDAEHIVEMLKLREIYRHLSNCADRGDEAANTICDIVVKMTWTIPPFGSRSSRQTSIASGLRAISPC